MNDAMRASAAQPITVGVSEPSGPRFPTLPTDGPAVNAAQHVAAGTGWRTLLAWVLAVLGVLILAASTMGVGLVLLLLAPVIDWFLRKRILAQIRGTSLEVGPNQLPEVHACVAAYARRLGLRETPAVYIVEGNTTNAFAHRLGSRHVVHLVDDVVWGALKAGNPSALAFVIAHELAHHALGHTGGVRSYLAQAYRALSRLDELSADAVALQLLRDRDAAYQGLIMLMVGPQLAPYVDRNQLFLQAKRVAEDKNTKVAERSHTHPFIARRIHALREVSLAGAG